MKNINYIYIYERWNIRYRRPMKKNTKWMNDNKSYFSFDTKRRMSEKYLRIVITACRRFFASRFASHLRMYFWKMIAASRIFKYFLLTNIPFHLLWIMAAISCFFIWNASSVLNNVLGNRMNNFVLEHNHKVMDFNTFITIDLISI